MLHVVPPTHNASFINQTGASRHEASSAKVAPLFSCKRREQRCTWSQFLLWLKKNSTPLCTNIDSRFFFFTFHKCGVKSGYVHNVHLLQIATSSNKLSHFAGASVTLCVSTNNVNRGPPGLKFAVLTLVNVDWCLCVRVQKIGTSHVCK